MGGSRGLMVLVSAMLLVLPASVTAQHSGGSFGGSSWGSGGGGSHGSGGGSWGGSHGSGGGGSWGSSSSGSGHSYTYSGGSGHGSYSSSGGGGSIGGLVCVLMIFVAIIVIGAATKKRGGGPGMMMGPPGMYGGPMGPGGMGGMYTPESFSLGALAIAFDSSARAQIQGELDRIAQTMNMGNNPNALNAAAATMAGTLSRYLDAAYLTHYAVSEGLNQQTAQQQFQAAVDQERGRYVVEVVRADAGGVRKIEGMKASARVEEGGGFVVVTLMVARRGRLTGFRPATDRAALAHDLQVLLAGPGALQALEVVWVPADPNDVMSSAEMAVKFSTLKPIAADARVGRRACAYCKSVFAAELGRCPSCGAPG